MEDSKDMKQFGSLQRTFWTPTVLLQKLSTIYLETKLAQTPILTWTAMRADNNSARSRVNEKW